jgi:gamma-carbonic anhydrase
MAIVRAFGGRAPRLGADVFLAETATVIGDVEIGEGSSLWWSAVARGDVGTIRIGKRTNVQDLTMIHVTGGKADTTIGDEVTIGHRVVIHGARIDDGCLVGIGAILLDLCIIGEGSVVGAGALVTPGTKIPPRSLVLGVPARIVRPLRDDETRMGREGAERYLELVRRYRAEGA